MKTLRHSLLAVVLFGSIGTWLWLERSSDEAPYSLIEDRLYVGGAVAVPPPGTNAVLNLCQQEDPYHVAIHLWEPIDGSQTPGIDWLRRVVAFIDAQRFAGFTTYVHCSAGMNRSGMVVIAYLMFRHSWTRDQALAFARSKRPQIQPNPTLLQLLAEWEGALKERTASRIGGTK